MNVSHDGDRVSRAAADGSYAPAEQRCDDAYIEGLIADLAGDDARAAAAALHMQPGSYACSTEQIDRMADIACSNS